MSVAAVLPITTCVASPGSDRAVSNEARALNSLIAEAWRFAGSVAIGEPRFAAQEALAAALRARAKEWKDIGTVRVEPSTYAYAEEFLALLPPTVLLPDVSVDPDGEINFEWDEGKRRVFSVSVGRDGTLTFAGLFGQAKIHGTEHLHEALPMVIADYLKRFSPSSS